MNPMQVARIDGWSNTMQCNIEKNTAEIQLNSGIFGGISPWPTWISSQEEWPHTRHKEPADRPD